MIEINTGGSAFPVFELEQFGEVVQEGSAGLTMRDYFAARAMQGICSSGPSNEWTDDMIAKESYQLADAMIKARGEN